MTMKQDNDLMASVIFGMMADEVEALNKSKGWYDESRTFGDDIALLHSEVSEALEAYRVGGATDQTSVPHAANDNNPKPEGVGSELADVLVRLLDTCKRYDVDLFAEWRRKMDFNWTRPVRHGGKRL